jgi:hypothetical protein
MSQDLRARLKQAFEQDVEPARAGLAKQVFSALPVVVGAPTATGLIQRAIDYIVKHWITTAAIGLTAIAAIAYVLATRTPDIAVYAGYIENRPQPAASLPSPWNGSSGVIFKGMGPDFDSGAIRIDNRTDHEITIGRVFVDIGSRHFELWGAGIRIPAHGILILTQTRIVTANPLQSDFDTSEALGETCGSVVRQVPAIHLTVDGHQLTFEDRNLVLTTGGRDLGNCPGKPSESHPWDQLHQ